MPSGLAARLKDEFSILDSNGDGRITSSEMRTRLLRDSRWSKDDVKELFRHIFATYDMPDGVTVRSDNGSQFESEVVRSYFAEQGTIHEFTKPATPEQNAHIEAYHSILQRAVCDQYLFTDLDHARDTLDRFRDFYNFERLHSGIGYRPPSEALAAMHVHIPDSTGINLNSNEHIKSIILGSQS